MGWWGLVEIQDKALSQISMPRHEAFHPAAVQQDSHMAGEGLLLPRQEVGCSDDGGCTACCRLLVASTAAAARAQAAQLAGHSVGGLPCSFLVRPRQGRSVQGLGCSGAARRRGVDKCKRPRDHSSTWTEKLHRQANGLRLSTMCPPLQQLSDRVPNPPASPATGFPR